MNGILNLTDIILIVAIGILLAILLREFDLL